MLMFEVGDCVGGLAGWVLSIYDNETVIIENCSVNGKNLW